MASTAMERYIRRIKYAGKRKAQQASTAGDIGPKRDKSGKQEAL